MCTEEELANIISGAYFQVTMGRITALVIEKSRLGPLEVVEREDRNQSLIWEGSSNVIFQKKEETGLIGTKHELGCTF